MELVEASFQELLAHLSDNVGPAQGLPGGAEVVRVALEPLLLPREEPWGPLCRRGRGLPGPQGGCPRLQLPKELTHAFGDASGGRGSGLGSNLLQTRGALGLGPRSGSL